MAVLGVNALAVGSSDVPKYGESCAAASKSETESWVDAHWGFIPSEEERGGNIPSEAEVGAVVTAVQTICKIAKKTDIPQGFTSELLSTAVELAIPKHPVRSAELHLSRSAVEIRIATTLTEAGGKVSKVECPLVSVEEGVGIRCLAWRSNGAIAYEATLRSGRLHLKSGGEVLYHEHRLR